ncbi:tudor domain-containing 6 isoform X2 [Acanthopagrus latus]|uniref:tudor domain-containing 6 isoform X2 n=1 Tax=Acanthopagrus latus TaxID=8177 RepID=UPI00187C8618|nr:tudor domain-containing 6 isoform X2 [Acanthopagrus latus]
MSSIKGLPTRGSDVTILITKVNLHPLCVLVEFWGKFSQERKADYESLAKDIQSPGNAFQELEGNPGDECLVQIDGTWYRSRIVSRNGSKYSVFLIDKGVSNTTITSKLAWGEKKHFQLPPEVEFCVLANVLPASPENRWSPVALEFLRSLSGKSVKAHVQDVLVPHRTFILHIPCISKQMYEMGIAKMSPDMFQDFVLMSLQSQSGVGVSQDRGGERLQKKELFLYPELPAGTVEKVIVTDVTNPQRIFCQLKVFSQELKKLSEQITQCCEGRITTCIVGPEMIGFPCAARGSDGRWYRSVLQQVLPTNKMVEVLNVDYGTKQFVQVEHIRPLAAEFFRLPVVTYVCSLHGIIDKGVGWTSSQIDYLRNLLLYKTVIAKFEYQSISEGVQYVTLYSDDIKNINKLFGSKENCSLECEKTLADYAICNTSYSHQHPAQQEANQKKMLTPAQTVGEVAGQGRVKTLPAEDLPLSSSHVSVVQHVSDPSEFWIQTENYANELDELMDSIYHLYKDSENKHLVKNPTVGLYCAANSEDGNFYRATVADVGKTQIKVFFVDYGNTEVVDKNNIKALPDEFKKLPCLALKCSLAGIRPKDGRWSQSACEFFIKAVTEKTLNVRVTAKHEEGYFVQLTDPKAQGEKDLSTLMCSSGFAEPAETQRQPKAKMTTQPAFLPPTQLPGARLSGVSRNKGMCHILNPVGPASNERRTPTFKEQMFSIGSVLDVNVSYIESPNDFWCQLVQNTGHYKLLMHKIQAHYAGSEFQPLVETACVARHPNNGMWYRALVIHRHETPHVDVLFVDYGQMETVSLYDLRRIHPEFLELQGQAFRCSLLNPIDPSSAKTKWNEEATSRFHSFVETAASNLVILKCTIYAVMYSEQKIVFNIVDLETPFESISASMVSLVKSAPPKVGAGSSFRLDTYYYSTHNVKTGTEEQVMVTCVNNVNQFYCHLERNADVTKDLKIKVNNLCLQLENVKLPTVLGTLCFARYTDGQWYRGQIKATKPAILVHFVDYGDTLEVEKCDLLPVPREANDIMAVPVQALVCGLSDVPASVQSEVNSWFETNATECKFRALVVAREPDGKLLVELYDGNTQINSKIKKMFQIEMHSEEQVVCQSWRRPEASDSHARKTPKTVAKQAVEMEDNTQTIKKNVSAPKPRHQVRDANVNLQSAPKPLRHVCENGQRVKGAWLQPYRPPNQRQSCESKPSNKENGSELAGALIKPEKESPLSETKQISKSKSPGKECVKNNDADKLPQLADLPSKSITSGMAADVYVSHCNSPLSFYVQLVREEDELFSLAEKLNDPESTPKEDIKDVHEGDLVQAEFLDDSSWYRAVVREILSNAMALVEFIDFGNTAVMPISKIGRLDLDFLKLPMYSTHCMLSDAAALGKGKVLDPEVMSAFREDIGGNGEKVLKCRFIRQTGSVWEVSVKDSGVNIKCKVPARCSTDESEITSEKLAQDKETPAQHSDIRRVPENSQSSLLSSCSRCYHPQEFSEGQKVEVYITTVNDAQTFWCQLADAEELDKLTSSVSEVGDAADHKPIIPGSLSPGCPCIALFADDHLWYRAEVIDKDGDELSVLFVDYGNQSQVNVTDVREMPTNLMETRQQAFLCELEGFDASHGSWDSGAVDELSALTTDKVLELTVTRVTREEGKIKYVVQMQCEGQVINEALKTWWKSSAIENKPGDLGPTTLCETSSLKETAPPKDQLDSECQEEVTAVVGDHPQRQGSEKQGAGELVDTQTTDDIHKPASSVEHSKSSEDNLHSESFVESQEEKKDQILSECVTTEPQIERMTESLRETAFNEGVKIVGTTMVPQTKPKDTVPCDSDETKLPPPPSNQSDQGILTLSCDESELETDKGTEEEGASEMDTSGPHASSSPLDENPTEAKDESKIATTGLESLPGEIKACSMDTSLDKMTVSDPHEQGDDSEVALVRDKPPSVTTTVKMVPREAVCPRESLDLETTDTKSEDLYMYMYKIIYDLTEQETEAGDGVPGEEVPCVTAHVEILTELELPFSELSTSDSVTQQGVEAGDAVPKEENDVMDEGDNLACHEDTYTALHADTDTTHSELHTCTTPAKELVDEDESVACLTDVCSDVIEPSEDSNFASARDDGLSSGTSEEMDQNESLLPHVEHKQLVALPSDAEPQACTVCCPDLDNLVEEVTCLVRQISLTDSCKDPQESETEDSEQLVHTEEESSSGELDEEISFSADDSFEAQLTKITHLSLIINDGPADILPVEQQPEE